jgi:hypothetical protein
LSQSGERPERTIALGHDAFESELAGMAEDSRKLEALVRSPPFLNFVSCSIDTGGQKGD